MFRSLEHLHEELLSGFGGRRAVVVGDLMIDRYLWGRVDRVSPEAPVPVVRLDGKSHAVGGAGNVARNLASLGLKVQLGGVTGVDEARDQLLSDLDSMGIDTLAVLSSDRQMTTVKTRIIAAHQQLIRIDEEDAAPLPYADQERLITSVAQRLAHAQVLVLSDYAKGVLTKRVCAELIRAARVARVPVLVDPKGRDFSRYRGATLITPNRAELAAATGAAADDLSELTEAAAKLRDELAIEYLVLTLSEQGMLLMGPGVRRHIPAQAREVYDVSGAGDTVIATFAACVAADLDREDTAHLANLAAGIVVGKIGTATTSAADLIAAVKGESAVEQAAKVCDLSEAKSMTDNWRAAGERVVFTNGCFDLLHVGHVTYLERARRLGHRLVVGINTDRSVRALKGENRPVIREGDRARVLAALASVDAVVLFDEDTPLRLIEHLRPDVLAKGADYTEDQVVGARQVRSWGGQVVLVPLIENRSTSGIVRQIGAGS
jgi:D-beta-D-heptose 7-phosphate kinase/D-beta-D-heptose 1-phosphate adenosyltransferase